jgi:hypothetical protein
MSYDFEVVLMTTAATGMPHASALQTSNPGLIMHVHEAPGMGNKGEEWWNCDRNFREWWKTHRLNVQAERVLFMEWDVFCNVDLRQWVPSAKRFHGMICAQLKTPIRDSGWPGFREVERLPREMEAYAIAAVPSALLMLDRDALDAIADARWDALFAQDVLSELRLATLVRYLGYQVADCAKWSRVTTTPQVPGPSFRGILHSVKEEVES